MHGGRFIGVVCSCARMVPERIRLRRMARLRPKTSGTSLAVYGGRFIGSVCSGAIMVPERIRLRRMACLRPKTSGTSLAVYGGRFIGAVCYGTVTERMQRVFCRRERTRQAKINDVIRAVIGEYGNIV